MKSTYLIVLFRWWESLLLYSSHVQYISDWHSFFQRWIHFLQTYNTTWQHGRVAFTMAGTFTYSSSPLKFWEVNVIYFNTPSTISFVLPILRKVLLWAYTQTSYTHDKPREIMVQTFYDCSIREYYHNSLFFVIMVQRQPLSFILQLLRENF